MTIGYKTVRSETVRTMIIRTRTIRTRTIKTKTIRTNIIKTKTHPAFEEGYIVPVSNESPVLHRARAEVWDGDHVLLGKWEPDVEVVLVVLQDLRAYHRGVLGLGQDGGLGPNPEIHSCTEIVRNRKTDVQR